MVPRQIFFFSAALERWPLSWSLFNLFILGRSVSEHNYLAPAVQQIVPLHFSYLTLIFLIGPAKPAPTSAEVKARGKCGNKFYSVIRWQRKGSCIFICFCIRLWSPWGKPRNQFIVLSQLLCQWETQKSLDVGNGENRHCFLFFEVKLSMPLLLPFLSYFH